MKYEELYDDFKRLFPEDEKKFFDLEKEACAEQNDGMHVMFGMVVCPFILHEIKDNPAKIQKAFEFIENMVASDDDDIVNLAEVTVLENLMTDEQGGMKRFGNYLGKESAVTVRELSNYFDIGE